MPDCGIANTSITLTGGVEVQEVQVEVMKEVQVQVQVRKVQVEVVHEVEVEQHLYTRRRTRRA